MNLKLLNLVPALVLFGCASSPDKVNLVHVHEAAVYSDPKSVFYSNDSLHESSISPLLQSKIKLPSKVKIAIIKLQAKTEGDEYRSFRIGKDTKSHLQNETTPYLLDLFNESPENFRKREIKSVLVPDSLVPDKADLKLLRNLGVTMQADLILVIDSRNDRSRENEVVKGNEVLSVSSADAYLVDTRTGVIVTSNSYTKESFLQKNNSDFTIYHTLDRARSDSEKKIFKKLAADIRDSVDSFR